MFSSLEKVKDFYTKNCENKNTKLYVSVSHHVDTVKILRNNQENATLIARSTYVPFLSSSPVSQTTVFTDDTCTVLSLALNLALEHNYKMG